ncbi:hypothetical protein CHS0354_028786 [Potamilus streckersoni]|uniref:BTB domain-containing protein n=1 Tax=Potamilus streckersoni TaxID=2493646 RepID=A0AAE0S8J6_9BIVA|nr:hypothetical protein CHS0354_028786 [Potamilus streckersoni]
MEKVYTSSDYSSQLLSQMSELWRGNKYCDAVLNLQDERFKLHKLVLMAACPNILRCLAHTEENNVFEFYLPEDVEKSAVRLIVNYLYIGSIQLNMANVYGIEKLAKQLRLCTLSQFCHDFISLLESETLSQSLLQPEIYQEYIPKHENIEVEKVVDPRAVDALNNSATSTLTEINNGNSSLPQLTDGFEQLPLSSMSIKTELDDFISPTLEEAISRNQEKTITIEPLLLPLASKSIKTELDASISPTMEEAIRKNQEKTITIEPLPVNNILQNSKSDNPITTAFATDSSTLDQHLGSDRLESHPVSHQTSSMRTKDPQHNSSTVTSLTPVLSMVACNPSTSQTRGKKGDDLDLIMTAEDEDFEDLDNEWVPQGDESSYLDYYPESTPDRSTKTKRKMSTKGPKTKRSKKDGPLTAVKKKVRGDKFLCHVIGMDGVSKVSTMSSASAHEKKNKQPIDFVFVPGVSKKDDGRRIYNKKLACFYCGKLLKHRLKSHLATQHSEEKDVASLLACNKMEQNKGFQLLKNNGNFKHNIKVLEQGKGKLIVVRRSTHSSREDDYLPCIHCLGFFRVEELWRHCRKCPFSIEEEKDMNARSSVLTKSRLLLAGGLTKRDFTLIQPSSITDLTSTKAYEKR